MQVLTILAKFYTQILAKESVELFFIYKVVQLIQLH